jgi:yopX protein
MIKNNFLYTFSELDTMGIDLDTLEVAGNIHENPELLEKEEK